MNESYTSHSGTEVADVLQVSGGTLRRWCILLEKSGYTFAKGGTNNQRFFSEHDIVVLMRVRDLIQHKRYTVNDAINTVVSMLKEEAQTQAVHDKQLDDRQPVDTSVQDRQDYTLNEILERLDKQEEFNKALLEKLDHYKSYIDNSLNRRDEQLTNALRQTLDTQKQLAIAETIAQEQAKSWWRRLLRL